MHTTNTNTVHTVGRPLLSTDAIGWLQPIRAETGHITSEDDMESNVGPEEVLEVTLEAGVVTGEVVERNIHSGGRVTVVDHVRRINPRGSGEAGSRVEERLKSIITTDFVGGRVSECDILETSGRDLVIIISVAPRAETIGGGIVKDGSVFGVRGIYLRVRGWDAKISSASWPHLWSSPNRGECRCNRTWFPSCLAWSGHNACARGRRNQFDGSVTS